MNYYYVMGMGDLTKISKTNMLPQLFYIDAIYRVKSTDDPLQKEIFTSFTLVPTLGVHPYCYSILKNVTDEDATYLTLLGVTLRKETRQDHADALTLTLESGSAEISTFFDLNTPIQ